MVDHCWQAVDPSFLIVWQPIEINPTHFGEGRQVPRTIVCQNSINGFARTGDSLCTYLVAEELRSDLLYRVTVDPGPSDASNALAAQPFGPQFGDNWAILDLNQ